MSIKQAFITAVQEILTDAKLLVKEVDGVWDNVTQDAYRAFAVKFGHDATQVANTQPTKIEQLPVHIQQYVAEKVAAATDAVEGAAETVKADAGETVSTAEEHVAGLVKDAETKAEEVVGDTPAPGETTTPAETPAAPETDAAPSSTEPPVQTTETAPESHPAPTGEQAGEQAAQ